MQIPCARPRRLDAYGLLLDSATLPIAVFDICHDAIRDYLYDLVHGCGITTEWEPRLIFQQLIPAAVLLASGTHRPRIVPDFSAAVAMPSIATGRQDRRGASQMERVLLWDVKTLHGGTQAYISPRARDEQSGAVAERAHRVWPDYQAHARRLDAQFHTPATPILDRLLTFTPTRSLVFGQYAEASDDVHDLLADVAHRQARRQWRRFGARTESEAYGFFVAALRRRVGVFVAREMARHRLRRVPFVGVPRAALASYVRRRGGGDRDDPQITAEEFFAFQFHSAVQPAMGA
jgi:hypothetical protein